MDRIFQLLQDIHGYAATGQEQRLQQAISAFDEQLSCGNVHGVVSSLGDRDPDLICSKLLEILQLEIHLNTINTVNAADRLTVSLNEILRSLEGNVQFPFLAFILGLTRLGHHSVSSVREKALRCIEMVILKIPNAREELVQSRPFTRLVKVVSNNCDAPCDNSYVELAAEIVSILCQEQLQRDFAGDVLGELVQKVLAKDNVRPTIKVWALLALFHIFDNQDERFSSQALLYEYNDAPSLCTTLTRLLELERWRTETSLRQAEVSLSCIHKLLANTVATREPREYKQLKNGVVKHLPGLLKYGTDKIRTSSCEVASMIAHHNPEELAQSVDFMNLLICIGNDLCSPVWQYAASVLSNIINDGKSDHIYRLVELGGVKPVVHMLGLKDAEITKPEFRHEAVRAIQTVAGIRKRRDDEVFQLVVDEFSAKIDSSVRRLKKHETADQTSLDFILVCLKHRG